MGNPFKNLQEPELFFGFVSAVGTNIDESMLEFKLKLESLGYRVVMISLSRYFPILQETLKFEDKLNTETEFDRINSYIRYGNSLGKHFNDSAILASLAIFEIAKRRRKGVPEKQIPTFERTAYLIRQFKRKEEIDLLRSVYGRLFFQVSVYSRRSARVEHLSRIFADGEGMGNSKDFRDKAEKLIQIDENEAANDYGQRVGKIFHDADFIVSADSLSPSVKLQIDRYCELLFSSNSISPTKHEYGMFLARAAALRTLDLSRQVGAAVFSDQGEIICLGSNEVPKALGGTYWSDELFDDREYKRKTDSNDKRKRELLLEVFDAFDPAIKRDDILKNKKVQESQFMDALEYGRIVHAEMSAIADAARNGRALKGSIMYTTTFPCHMCAKHIVASGVGKVVFLEPYPKSLAETLHADSIEIESGERGRYSKFPSVKFEHFYGVTPRRYRELFERSLRKKDGKFLQYIKGETPRPNINIIYPFYQQFENAVFIGYKEFIGVLMDRDEVLDD